KTYLSQSVATALLAVWGCRRGPCLPLPSLRLMVPPLRLVSAAIWQTIQQRHVMDYGMLEEFVTMVTEMVPELLNLRQRAQLILGLRARVRRRSTCLYSVFQATDAEVGLSESNFLGLVQTLLKDPDERNHFFQDVFPVEFGPGYDAAIQNLMCQFLSRLEKLLPMSDFQQASSLLGDVPSVLEECVESVSHPQQLKTLLQYHRDLGHITWLSFGSLFPSFTDPPSSTDGDCILSALCLPPVERVVIATEVEKEGKSMDVKEREEGLDSRSGECEKNKTSSVSDEDDAEFADQVTERDPEYETVMVIGEDGIEKPFKLLKKPPQKKEETHVHKCNECGKEFGLKSTLTAHKRIHNPLRCAYCRRMFPDQETLAIHKVEHKPVQCTMCEKSFNVIRYLSRHYVDDHQFSGPFRCTYCERSYADLAALIRHQRTHTGGEPPYKCSHCPKKFHFETALVTHQRNHTGEKPCLCWECGKTFQSKGILKSHMNRVHTPQVKRIPCSQCNKVFRDKGQMKMHENVYHKGVRYPCSYCGKGFYSPAPLARHVLIHTGENPYSCTYKECTRVFKSASELRIHMRYHTGERPFKCKDCGKGFVQAHYLTIHRRSHTGEKPYPCLTCDKSFGTSHQLSRHMKTHTGEKPYQCLDCGKAFNRRDRLRTHQDKCHPTY
uniref:C2H2-type domain-containing protein n=1 Tax=Hucho hucho TaxID=62062 RepID=A0A4W5LJ48_9TELE